jgi:hypothetical protein
VAGRRRPTAFAPVAIPVDEPVFPPAVADEP